MSHETRYFRVTTRHPTGWQDGVHEFRVSTTRASDDDGSGTMPLAWYAVAPRFGCSKNYMSPTLAIRAMCEDHACEVVTLVEYDPAVVARQSNERAIVQAAIEGLTARGYFAQWYEMTDRAPSQNVARLMADYAMCDEMVLNVFTAMEPGTPRMGWVFFVLGNDDGTTVISDYTMALEPALAMAEAMAETLAG